MGLETVEIVIEIQDHFAISLPDAVASKCETVTDLQKVVVELLVQEGRTRSRELDSEVFRDLVKISADVTGNDPATIRPESRWLGDITKYG
jgi:acyl carrier protein